MGNKKKKSIKKLQKRLNIPFDEAYLLEVSIAHLLTDPVLQEIHPAPDYEGYIPDITGEKRISLINHIEEMRESGEYRIYLQ